MGKMIKEPTAIKRKAKAYSAYGAQAAQQPGWGGMGSTPKGKGAKRMFKRAPK